jgi:hypothetical protein
LQLQNTVLITTFEDLYSVVGALQLLVYAGDFTLELSAKIKLRVFHLPQLLTYLLNLRLNQGFNSLQLHVRVLLRLDSERQFGPIAVDFPP